MAPSKRVRLETDRMLLTLPGPTAAGRVLAYHDENRAHLARWEPTRPGEFYTVEYWVARLQQDRRDLDSDLALRLYLFPKQDDRRVIGNVSFTNIVRGPLQACFLGYSLDREFEGRGYMCEALRAATDHVFRELTLHRIMANYVPTNERSGQLLRRLGFVVEGYARDYLFIDGQWRDHLLTSLTSPYTGSETSR